VLTFHGIVEMAKTAWKEDLTICGYRMAGNIDKK